MMEDAFTRFEHEGWERVADKYDSVWSSLTRQFIPYLIDIGQIVPGMSVLDVACGPGYVSGALRKIGAMPTGIDFSKKMINFGLLHLSHPEQACVEAFRVLKSGGKFGFTVWAGPEENPGAKIVNDAIEAHADLNVQLPEGPPHYPYGEKKECQNVLARAGFDGNSMIYETRSVQWHLPTATYFFEAERDAAVRTAGLLARQSPATLDAIRSAIEEAVRRYARGEEFVIPMAAHVVAISKGSGRFT